MNPSLIPRIDRCCGFFIQCMIIFNEEDFRRWNKRLVQSFITSIQLCSKCCHCVVSFLMTRFRFELSYPHRAIPVWMAWLVQTHCTKLYPSSSTSSGRLSCRDILLTTCGIQRHCCIRKYRTVLHQIIKLHKVGVAKTSTSWLVRSSIFFACCYWKMNSFYFTR